MTAVDPVLIGGAVAAIAIIAAGAYATLTNGEASVDLDGDDEADVVFGGGDSDCEDEERNPLEDLYVHEDLTIIDGVGPATSDSLEAAGFQTVEDVADAAIAELVEAEGVGERRALTLTLNAAAALNEAE